MKISVTERGTFKRCERRWFLSSHNRMNLEPYSGASALILGKLIHASLENWNRDTDSGNSFMELAQHEYSSLVNEYTESQGVVPSTEVLAPLLDVITLGEEMIRNYLEYYKTPLPQGFRYVEAEQKVEIAIPHSEHWECNNCHAIGQFNLAPEESDTEYYCAQCNTGLISWQHHFLTGTFDELVADIQNRLWILERKTYGNRPRREVLQMNDQFLAYIWMLMQLFGTSNIGGVLYDGMWKRGIVTERGPNRKLEALFYRDIFMRNSSEIAEFEQLLPIEAAKMASVTRLEDATINRRWEGCFDCNVRSICLAMSRGEDWEYVIETEYRTRPETRLLAEVDED